MADNMTRNSEDVAQVRAELVLTVHEIALSLSRRTHDPKVLADISNDLIAEARKLRHLSI